MDRGAWKATVLHDWMAKHAQEGAEENSLNLMKGNIKNPQSNSLIEKACMLSPQGQKQAEESARTAVLA